MIKNFDELNSKIKETERRRSIQEKYNEEHNIVPKTIIKEIRDVFVVSSFKGKGAIEILKDSKS